MSTTPVLWKSQTQVNTTDNGARQLTGQVAALGDGGYVVAWTDQSNVYNPAGSAVLAQRYNALGEKLGGEINIGGSTTVSQFMRSITAMPDGGVAIAFEHSSDILVKRYDANLNFIRTDVISDLSALNPSIAAFADNSYVVTYDFGPQSTSDVVARIVSPSGTVGGQFTIHSSSTRQAFSSVDTLSNGNFVVVLADEFSVTDIDIKFRIMTAQGAQVLGPTNVIGASNSVDEISPDVAALTGGGFVVAWDDEAGDSSFGGIRATIYSNAGASIRSDFLVNTTQLGFQFHADVLALADGGFLVAWEDQSSGSQRAQRFDALGNRIGSEFIVRTGDTEFGLHATQLADGRIVYVPVNEVGSDTDIVHSIWDVYGPRPGDLNHDVRGDILWRHDGDGLVGEWLMNGAAAPATATLSGAPPDWNLEGTGDFNGDGLGDILWRHVGGDIGTWHMNGTQKLSTQVFANAPPQWHVQGTADFNGDGQSDLLWRHNDGTVGTWHMNGATTLSTQAFANAPPDWHIQGTGDFNGDGFDDILWQHDNGAVGTWHMAGATTLSTQAFASQPADWHVQGTGDFNGDGKDDILWRHDSGLVGIWLMNGAQIIGGPTFGPVGNDWHIEGVGDFNGDGRHDIVWRHDNGTVGTWHMNGAQIVSTASFGAQPADWHIVGQQYDYI